MPGFGPVGSRPVGSVWSGRSVSAGSATGFATVGTATATAPAATAIGTVAVSIAENATLNYVLPANSIGYSIVGGADQAQFEVFYDAGVFTDYLRFTGTGKRDFEAPADVGSDNVYEVAVYNNETTAVTTYRVAVTDVVEGGGTNATGFATIGTATSTAPAATASGGALAAGALLSRTVVAPAASASGGALAAAAQPTGRTTAAPSASASVTTNGLSDAAFPVTTSSPPTASASGAASATAAVQTITLSAPAATASGGSTASSFAGLGDEAVTNGTFDANIVGWQNNSDPGGLVAWDAGRIRLTKANSGFVEATQLLPLVLGQKYRLSAELTASSGIFATLAIRVGAGTIRKDTSSGSPISFDFVTAAAVNYRVWLDLSDAAFNEPAIGEFATFDNISIREVLSFPQVTTSAPQATATGVSATNGNAAATIGTVTSSAPEATASGGAVAYGGEVGRERVANGTFDTGIAPWSNSGGNPVWEDGKLKVTSGAGFYAEASLYQVANEPAFGTTVRFSGEMIPSDGFNAQAAIYIGASPTPNEDGYFRQAFADVGSNFSVDVVYSYVGGLFLYLDAGQGAAFEKGPPGTTATFDNISVREVLGRLSVTIAPPQASASGGALASTALDSRSATAPTASAATTTDGVADASFPVATTSAPTAAGQASATATAAIATATTSNLAATATGGSASTAAASIPQVSASAPQAAASASVTASAAFPAVTASTPSASATGGATATSTIGTRAVSALAASATGAALASGDVGSRAAAAPQGNATGGQTIAGTGFAAFPIVTSSISNPVATGSGKATPEAIPARTASAPQATGSVFVVATAAFTLTIVAPPTASATGGSLALSDIHTANASPPAAIASVPIPSLADQPKRRTFTGPGAPDREFEGTDRTRRFADGSVYDKTARRFTGTGKRRF